MAPAKHQHAGPRQPGDRAHRGRQLVLSDERDRVDRDALPADVVAVCLADGTDRHLAHLRAAAHDDHALAVDLHQRLGDVHRAHDGELLQARQQAGKSSTCSISR